jgi:hypothetical protein
MAGTSAQGTTFSFGGTDYSITNFTVSETQDLIDGSHLGIAAGSSREYVGGFATDVEVSIDYIGSTIISAGTSGALAFSGTYSGTSGDATVASSSITGSVGSLISGTATFRVA